MWLHDDPVCPESEAEGMAAEARRAAAVAAFAVGVEPMECAGTQYQAHAVFAARRFIGWP